MREEPADVAAAAAHARALAPGLPLAACGYSFGALMVLRWIAGRGEADSIALVGVPLRSPTLEPLSMPLVPDGAFVVAAERDQFGNAAELRAALPRARIHEIAGVDHFFAGKQREVGAAVAAELARALSLD